MKKILALILDGLGQQKNNRDELIDTSNMNNYKKLLKDYPHVNLNMNNKIIGNNINEYTLTEFNYMVMGSGRKIKNKEELVNDFLNKIDYENKNIIKLIKNTKKDIHIIGKYSNDNIDNIIKMYKFLCDNDFQKIHFHIIGSDTSNSTDLLKNIELLKNTIKENKIGDISSIAGYKYALNSNNMSYTKIYYDLLVKGIGKTNLSVEKTIKDSYFNGLSEKDIIPTLTSRNTIKNDDIVIWMNYDKDESMPLLLALKDELFNEFDVDSLLDLDIYSFYMNSKILKIHNFIENTIIENSLGLYLSKLDFNQIKIAEEKYFPYISYFMDGGYDGKINKCDKIIIPSIEDNIIMYKPEMNCIEITKKTINSMNNDYDFILTMLPNIDEMYKTKNKDLISKSCIAVDLCLGKLLEKAEDNFYTVVILSSHYSAEIDSLDNNEATVPFIICDNKIKLKEEGSLVNIVPTILDYMDIAIPKEMEETESLLIEE